MNRKTIFISRIEYTCYDDVNSMLLHSNIQVCAFLKTLKQNGKLFEWFLCETVSLFSFCILHFNWHPRLQFAAIDPRICRPHPDKMSSDTMPNQLLYRTIWGQNCFMFQRVMLPKSLINSWMTRSIVHFFFSVCIWDFRKRKPAKQELNNKKDFEFAFSSHGLTYLFFLCLN